MRSGFGHLDETNRYIVEDHYLNPRKSEPIPEFNADARIDNPFCGDEVYVQLRVADGIIDSISVPRVWMRDHTSFVIHDG